MKSFPVLTSVQRAYKFAHSSYRVWIQYAMIVMLIKAGCTAAMIMMDAADMPLRMALIYLPATLVEGLFAGFIIKLSLIQSRKQGNMLAVFSQREMQACMIVYTLIHLTIACFMAIGESDIINVSTPQTMPETAIDDATDATIGEDAETQPVSMMQSLMAVCAFMAAFWLYRVAILYVPIAMGVSARRYMRVFNKFSDSLWLMATSLLVVVPPMLLLMIILQLFMMTQSPPSEELNTAQLLIATLLEIPFGVVILVLNSAALSFVITPRLKGEIE